MKQKTKIAIIGGTGKLGKYLVKQLMNQGFNIKILVRNPENFKIKNDFIEVVPGDVASYSSILSLIDGCDAVISTLGLGIPASEPTIFSLSTKHVIQAMHVCNVQRYIVTTGLNVDSPFDKKSHKTIFATEWMRKNYPVSTADKQTEFDILSASNIDWTLVRLPLIDQTDEKKLIKVSLEDCSGEKISVMALADFLIEQLLDDNFLKKSPFIANI